MLFICKHFPFIFFRYDSLLTKAAFSAHFQIINDLEDMEEATDLQLANKLEEVIKLMDESSVTC